MSCCQQAGYPCTCPLHRGMVALPACWPHYVIPCSHLLDPYYSSQQLAMPRMPQMWESATRARGTGMIWGPQCIPPTYPPMVNPLRY